MDQPRRLDAATIVGLLADDDRRKVFAAVELGAATIDEIGARQGVGVAIGFEHVVDAIEIGRLATYHGDVTPKRLQQAHE